MVFILLISLSLCCRCVPYIFFFIILSFLFFVSHKNRIYYLFISETIMNRIDRHQLIAYSLLTKWKKRPKTEYIREKHSHEKKKYDMKSKLSFWVWSRQTEERLCECSVMTKAWFWLVDFVQVCVDCYWHSILYFSVLYQIIIHHVIIFFCYCCLKLDFLRRIVYLLRNENWKS